MKESEAKNKTCPYLLIAMKLGIISIGHIPQIRQEDFTKTIEAVPNSIRNCLGSQCMMWIDTSDMSERRGHCGLVNK